MKNEDEFEKWMDNEVRELEIYIQAQEKSPEHMWAKGAKSNTIASLSLTQQRMVEWLEKYRQLKTKPTAQRQDSTQDQLRDVVEQANNMGCYDAADVISTLIGKTEVSIDTNKPTAPKNLVEELRAYTRKRTEEGGSPRYFREHEIYEIINRYQPVETTGGLVEELTEMCKKIRGFGFDRVDLICVEEAISRHAKEQGKVVDKAGRCKQCCGEMVYIRGRIPGEPNRIVCPTCLQEKADDRNSQTMSGSSEQKAS